MFYSGGTVPLNPLKTIYYNNLPSVCVLLCAAILVLTMSGAYMLRLPNAMHTQLNEIDAMAPLAAPTAVISAKDEDLILSDEAASSLSAYGTVVCATTMTYGTEDSVQYDLLALPQTYLSDAAVLREGRMPQNETECVIVPYSAAGDVLGSIGSAILLSSEADGTASTLTIVGIGENRHSALTHLHKRHTQAQILTTDTAAWCDTAPARDVVLLSVPADHTNPTERNHRIKTDILSVESSHYAEQLSALLAVSESAYAEAKAAADAAEEAVHIAEISVIDAENKVDTATLRTKEAEANLLAASDALQLERQQFYSDMEKYEYYSSGQLALINRRDLAEESFAAQEAAILVLKETLDAAYLARDAANAYLAEMNAAHEKAVRHRDLALEALDRISAYTTGDRTAPQWEISLRTDEPDYLAAIARMEAARTEAAPYLFVALILTSVLSIALIRSDIAPNARIRFLLLPICAAVIGAALGGWLLPTLFVL